MTDQVRTFLTEIAVVIGILAIIGLWTVILAWFFRCKHAWELVDKTELPSRIRELTECGMRDKFLWSEDLRKMASRTIVLALRCPKCGEARIYKESAAD